MPWNSLRVRLWSRSRRACRRRSPASERRSAHTSWPTVRLRIACSTRSRRRAQGLIILDEAHEVCSSSAEKKSAEDGGRDPVPWLMAALDQGAMSVPFGDWVGALGVRRGTAVAVASQLRSLLRESKPLTTPKEHAVPGWPVNARDATRFYLAVSDELAPTVPLERIASMLERSSAARAAPSCSACAGRRSNNGRHGAACRASAR